MTAGCAAGVETFCWNVSTPLGASVVPNNVETGRYKGYRTQSTRLPNWDYAGDGAYFITICTKNRQHWLSRILEGEAQLTAAGEIVAEEWLRTAARREYAEIDEFVVMPNHLHGILHIRDRHPRVREGGARSAAIKTFQQNVSTAGPRLVAGSVGAIVGQFKSACVKRIRAFEPEFGWQARFYDHIIRDEHDLNRIREYIVENPVKWDVAEDVPENIWM